MNRMIQFLSIAISVFLIASCGGGSDKDGNDELDANNLVEMENGSDQQSLPESIDQRIVGNWLGRFDDGCLESFEFSEDGSIEIHDLNEIQRGTYSVGELLPEINRYSYVVNIDTDNESVGCDGQEGSSAGSTFSLFLAINEDSFDVYANMEFVDPIFSMSPLVKMSDFASEDIFNRQLIAFGGNNFIVLGEDGSISGTWADSPVVGVWELRDGLWCRTYSEFAFDSIVGVEDCQQWERNGNIIRGVRSGEGSYTLTVTE